MITNKYATDEEYELPEYKKISAEMLKIFKATTKADLTILEGNNHYVDGQGFSRYWEYPWAIINSKVSKDMKVLDVGCGRAPFLFYLGKVIGCEAHGVDYDGHGCVEDGLWGCDEGFNAEYNFTVKKADVREKLPYPYNTFDRVFCISTIEHMNNGDEVKRAAKEMVRVLKPGGFLVITVDDGLYQKEIEEASGLPYLGECDFSRPKHKKPYSVLGMIFFKAAEPTVIVTPDGSDDIKDIQEGIDALPPEGGTVYVKQEKKKKDKKEDEEVAITTEAINNLKDIPPEPPKKEGITFKEIGEKIKSKFKRKK